ncbi:MAG: hypothetical protein ACPGJV_10405 [Bacteriovoracaceae bacterium]
MKKVFFISTLFIMMFYFTNKKPNETKEVTSFTTIQKVETAEVIEVTKVVTTESVQEIEELKNNISTQEEDEKIQMALAQIEYLKELTGEVELIEEIVEDLKRNPSLITSDFEFEVMSERDKEKLFAQMFPDEEFRGKWMKLLAAIERVSQGEI